MRRGGNPPHQQQLWQAQGQARLDCWLLTWQHAAGIPALELPWEVGPVQVRQPCLKWLWKFS